MNSILLTLNDKQSSNNGTTKFDYKKTKRFLLESTISIELAEPSIIKNEPEQVVFFNLPNIQTNFSFYYFR
jgi:hypothetical protein